MQTKNLKNYNQIHKELRDIFTCNGRHYSSQDDLNIIHEEVFYFIKNLNSSSEEQSEALRQALKVFLAPHSRLNILKLAYLMEDKRLAQYLIDMQLLPRAMYSRVFYEGDGERKPDKESEIIVYNSYLFKNMTLKQLDVSKLALLWFIKGVRQTTSTINFLFYMPEIVNLIGEYVESNVFFSSTNMAGQCSSYLDNWKGIEEQDHPFYFEETSSLSDDMDADYQFPLVLHSGETTSTSDEIDDEAIISEFEILSFNMFKAPVFDPEKTMIALIKNLVTYINSKWNDKDWAFYSAYTLKNTFNSNINNMDFKMFIIDAYINKNTDQLFANYKGKRLLNAFQRSCRGFEASISQGAKRYAEANSLDMLSAQLEILKLLKYQSHQYPFGLTEDAVKPVTGNQEKCCIQ